MKIALVVGHPPSESNMRLARQIGVTDLVTGLPPEGRNAPVCDLMPLIHHKMRVQDAGLTLSVIESFSPPDSVNLGLPERDRDIDNYCQTLANIGAAGIPIVCYNFMESRVGVLRTSRTTRTRGGAMVTSFDYSLVKDAPPAWPYAISEEQMWDNLAYFLERVIPVAEEAKVKMALHPDDPPISPIRGLPRIIRSVEAFDRVLNMAPSDYNGLTLCQGCFSEMGVNIPQTIHHFSDKVFFVHFRDVKGALPKFEESFHDDGKTDMFAAMKAYMDIGFDGPMRPDHVPNLEGEDNARPGYTMLGRLHAVGYMKALMEAAAATGS
jgi:mannonate dehydratase